MESIIAPQSAPIIKSIFCLLSILGYANTLDRVAPVIKRLNRYFRDFIDQCIASGKLFDSIVTKETNFQFDQKAVVFLKKEQAEAWWKSFFNQNGENPAAKILDNELKFSYLLYKKVKVNVTRDALNFMKDVKIPSLKTAQIS